MLYKDEAVVLRTMRLGEADRIVTLIGRSNGKIRAVAKGVRRTKSRFGGRLEPFTHVSVVMWRGKSDLDTVTQVEVLEPFRPVREDLDRFALGEVMLEACDRVVQEREPSSRGGPAGARAELEGADILDLLVQSLRDLCSDDSPIVLASFLLRLSAIAGFAPSMDRCAECGAPPSWFSPGQGGAVCYACRSPDSEEVGSDILHFMGDLAARRFVQGPRGAIIGLRHWRSRLSDSEIRSASRLARFYTEYHLEKRLKSAAAVDAIRR
ncbi:MAG: DNA repair protein RecO [Actinomycetota bacterium]|nr:DNA repair protein RecO [Actinomycetota bacterium]